tara:strand:+ start:110 stop:331 length:222 start_codon:yes stop_codon:yes gene_type:complete
MTLLAKHTELLTEILQIESLIDLENLKQKIKKDAEISSKKCPKYVCNCGSKINIKGKKDHENSAKHRKWMNSL